MPEEPVVQIRPITRYQIVLFVVLLLWAFLGFTFSQTTLVAVISNPGIWLLSSVGVLASLIPPILLVAWKVKQQAILREPIWEMKTQEVDLSEFRQMMNEIADRYSFLVSRYDFRMLLLSIVTAVAAVGIPFLLLATWPLAVAAYPYLFGAIILVFGVFLASFLQRALPNSVTSQFPFHSPRRLQNAVMLMWKTPGVAWAGVSVDIGRSGNYYTIRNPAAVARIEGIESPARIEAVTDKSGRILEAVSTISLEPTEDSLIIRISPTSGDVASSDLVVLVRRTLETYIAAKGSNEFLDEILEELGMSRPSDMNHRRETPAQEESSDLDDEKMIDE
ncbi:MAG: hypothetical protein JSW61_13345 [Candidatus Thorarchaeota archaeon]|nr:MAG: hypothetical protein JSW61_13345 [Candidatus Thorarchaeota archaeon]